ncbi:MAG: ABC transporter ATP-binding protein [Limimaricola soesokkakensis]|uniref:ABC-2 type transport system ATP-binding protein n=1 Tax=Limimaricola soesokkakensis TaxID=1343159 RepID=A0A1X6Z7Y1_9RHOB|nr:ABC transporter ATP-binding protein [Limimaricola soesokkakensis]PSK86602.1 ABC-2 type transport system ATP-binding protein [Limimaricola soesokkakensis]SLN43545.1 putative ABC transporter ATP-binding protein YbhF [Limimaricola soesokkakensis]
MAPIVSVRDLTKTYAGGFTALDGVSLDIEEGEIIALLGPNGAGKTTLISTICGITMPTGGTVEVGGHDVVRDWRRARDLIGLVPQEIALEPFSTVWNNVRFTRGLFDRPRDDAHLERLLRDLSLWEKRDAKVMELSGGMKRRVLIAKALSHGPRILFLDEPTAGVDVELRRDMWRVVERLRGEGVTIILTTHYIEEAEAIADRIGVISKGRIMLVERTEDLMRRLGRKELRIELAEPVETLPDTLRREGLERVDGGQALVYTYDTHAERTGITALLADLQAAGLQLADLSTSNSSLEEIFVGLVKEDAA